MFDFDARYGTKRKSKRFKQQILETVLQKLKKRKHLLVGEEEEQ